MKWILNITFESHDVCIGRKFHRFSFLDVTFPPDNQRILPELLKSPIKNLTGVVKKKESEKFKHITKRLIEIRGPELYHNYLIHKQYGLAVSIIFCLLISTFHNLKRLRFFFCVGGGATWLHFISRKCIRELRKIKINLLIVIVIRCNK